MKIAVLSFYTGIVERGAETAVSELTKRWRKKHTVRMYTAEKSSFITVTHLQQTGPLSLLYFLYSLIVIFSLMKWQPDIVIPVNRGWQGILVRLYCWMSGARMVVSGQAGYKDRMTMMTRPDGFVALTHRSAAWMRRFSGGMKVAVIPNGVDLHAFSDNGKKATIPLSRPIVICVAGPEPYKRVALTIDAVAIVKHASLLLVGGDEKIALYGKEKLGKRFKRILVPHSQMPELYRSADIFTLVSESTEAFGTAMIEAAACGLPVVVPDDELRRELFGGRALYVKDPANVREYAAVLTRALDEKTDYSRTWLHHYNWDVIAEKYLDFFMMLQ